MIPLSEYSEQDAKNALIDVMGKFISQGSDCSIILKNRSNSMTFGEVLRLLESSLSIQKEELIRQRQALKRAVRHMDNLAQGQLL